MSDLIFDPKFFDDDGNWENSEVMRNFVDLLAEREQVADSQPTETFETAPLVSENAHEQELPSEYLDNVRANISRAVEELQKIANDSVQYGNENATYKIEKTIYKLEDILINLDSPGE